MRHRVVEQEFEEGEATEAVGQHVVGVEVERGPPPVEPADEGHVPRRAIRVEGRRLEQGDEIEHLPGLARRRGLHLADVVVGVEAGDLLPDGAGAGQGGVDRPAPQA